MTSPLLTTGSAPAAGFNGIGLIFTQFTVSLAPELVMMMIRTTSVNVTLTPRLSMMGPQTQQVILSPKLIMRGGTVGRNQVHFTLTPVLTMGNGSSETTSFKIQLTPSLTMTGTYHASPQPGRVYSQSVQRAATI